MSYRGVSGLGEAGKERARSKGAMPQVSSVRLQGHPGLLRPSGHSETQCGSVCTWRAGSGAWATPCTPSGVTSKAVAPQWTITRSGVGGL